jgi:Methyltransferase domain
MAGARRRATGELRCTHEPAGRRCLRPRRRQLRPGRVSYTDRPAAGGSSRRASSDAGARRGVRHRRRAGRGGTPGWPRRFGGRHRFGGADGRTRCRRLRTPEPGHGPAAVAVMAAGQLGLRQESFDVVCMASAIYLLHEQAAVLRALRNLLRPRGRLAVSDFATRPRCPVGAGSRSLEVATWAICPRAEGPLPLPFGCVSAHDSTKGGRRRFGARRGVREGDPA